MDYLVALTLLLPLLCLGARLFLRCGADGMRAVLVLAPLPLVVLGVVGEGAVDLPLLQLAARFEVDATNRPLLLLAGLGWSLAGWLAADTVAERARSFGALWLFTLAGQTAALLSADVSSFYLGYVVMTFAAYGLVVHARTAEALRAGRIYIVLSVVGEALVLSGLLLAGALHGNTGFAALHEAPVVGVAPVLLFCGFAVKLGIVPLHVWLPLAHPVAPVPASAVLSGLLVKAGLLGMLRLVPPDALASPHALDALVAVGVVTACYGALVGLTQTRLKTVLAYSTISQMGLALVGFGAVAARGETAAAAVGLFALHHGLNKIALFLAAGHRPSGRIGRLLFLAPAAALAGVPLSSGMLAKVALKDGLAGAGGGAWAIALSLSSVLTTVLLLHAYRLWRAQSSGRTSPHPAWAMAAVAGLLVPWAWAARQVLLPGLGPSAWWDALWPVAAGVALFAVAPRVLRGRRVRIPEGDLVALLAPLFAGAARALAHLVTRWVDWQPRLPDLWPREQTLRRAEVAVGRLAMAGMFLLIVLLALWLAML